MANFCSCATHELPLQSHRWIHNLDWETKPLMSYLKLKHYVVKHNLNLQSINSIELEHWFMVQWRAIWCRIESWIRECHWEMHNGTSFCPRREGSYAIFHPIATSGQLLACSLACTSCSAQLHRGLQSKKKHSDWLNTFRRVLVLVCTLLYWWSMLQ